MAVETAWLIGSYASLPEQDLTIEGTGTTVSAGDYYLYDPTNALSLLYAVQQAMLGAGVVGATAVLCRNRKVKLASGGANFTITWGDLLLRNLLGFDANLSGASSYVAPAVSPILWSPARNESPHLARFGARGHKVHAVFQAVSPYSGKTEAMSHGYREYNRFTFPHVDVERLRTLTDGEGGVFDTWFDNVAVPANLWKLYREVSEDTASTTAVTLDTPLGPYVFSAERRGVSYTYDRSRGKEYTDEVGDVTIPCHVVPEYGD